MARFGKPPNPKTANLFPGISAKNFDPVSASVCYQENIQREIKSRSNFLASAGSQHIVAAVRPADAFSDGLPGFTSIGATYSRHGFTRDRNSGRWLPPGQLPHGASEEASESITGLSESPAHAISSAPNLRVQGKRNLHRFGGGGVQARKALQSQQPLSEASGVGCDAANVAFNSTWRTPKRGTWRSSSERDLGKAGDRLTQFQAQVKAADLIRQRCGAPSKQTSLAMRQGQEEWSPGITWC
eukprot:TRINITY_DN40356_c0_g1_i1.p1 TRINITY_DN40356_c0_g1~~TRINITY_DN40356_c0_g1_i1.p1  ORF type:complete len:242 (-),score=35.06 TRINITY_DN40356_c0_g1_i1:99-824(-)